MSAQGTLSASLQTLWKHHPCRPGSLLPLWQRLLSLSLWCSAVVETQLSVCTTPAFPSRSSWKVIGSVFFHEAAFDPLVFTVQFWTHHFLLTPRALELSTQHLYLILLYLSHTQ